MVNAGTGAVAGMIWRSATVLMLGVFQLPAAAQLELEVAFDTLTFERPVDLQHAGDGSARLFVVEQAGVIRAIPVDADRGSSSLFLDIRDRVRRRGNEEGLLGLAFHPDFAINGSFFVNYTASSPRRTVISRFHSDGRSVAVDPFSEEVVLQFLQPFSNHNGGQIVFGPDGLLYIATGDGGSGGDPQGNGQNRETLLGKILRLDVDRAAEDTTYAIPGDNPFVGEENVREEIFALGLRNPWRFSFDPLTGWLWTGDVGQNAFEEVDVVRSGGNYGWNVMEGNSCFSKGDCDSTGFEAPVWEYGRDQGTSITGGFVYRGPSVPELSGAYVYADFVSGRIWALRLGEDQATNVELLNTDLNISSFGVDADQELYICSFDGRIYRFKATIPIPTGIEAGAQPLPRRDVLVQSFPNPFNGGTTIRFDLATPGFVELQIFNAKGQRVRTLIHDIRPPGSHREIWNGHDDEDLALASGVYLYRLSTPTRSLTRRLVLLR